MAIIDENKSFVNHELLVVNTFIDKNQRNRFNTLLSSKKGRAKARGLMSHSIRFVPHLIHEIPTNKQTSEEIIKILLQHKASTSCYLISEHTRLDKTVMGLAEAINEVVGSGIATIVSCIPGKLAYFEGEGFNNRFILISDKTHP